MIGTLEEHPAAAAAAKALVDSTRDGPPDGPLAPSTAFVGPSLLNPFATPVTELGAPTAVEPIVLRGGAARGPVWASNLVSLTFLAGSAEAPDFRGTIVCWEATQIRLIELDHMLQRLRHLGVLQRLGAMLVGVPVRMVGSERALTYLEIVERAMEGTSCPVVLDAFVGTGTPSPLLRLGAVAEVEVGARGATLHWPMEERCRRVSAS